MRTIQFFLFGLVVFTAALSDASVILKVTANNPSSLEKREISLKSYLPKRVRPEHIINADKLEVGYDVKRNQCYVYKTLALEAQAVAHYNVEIDDIWLVEEDVVGQLLSQANDLTGELKDTQYAEVALQIQKHIEDTAKAILSLQEDTLIFKVGPAEHIAAYDTNQERLEQIKSNIKDLEQFLRSSEKDENKATDRNEEQTRVTRNMKAKEIKERILTFGTNDETSCLVEEALKSEKEPINLESPQTVLMKVKFENPSAEKQQTAPLRFLLVREAGAGDIINPGNLKVGFDFEKNLYYLYNDDVTLAPAEVKEFDIVLNNKWSISRKEVYGLKVYIDSLMKIEVGSPELEKIKEQGQQMIGEIYALLKQTDAVELTEDQVVLYRNNLRQLENIRQSTQRIEDFFIKENASPELKIMEQEVICLNIRSQGKEAQYSSDASGIFERIRAKLKGGMIFKGKSLSTVDTWKIIYYIIIFLGMISGVFYFVNIRQQKSTMFDPLTGAFARGYALERFREELKIAKGANNKCSLLVMDIDKFKGINDAHGHAVGDTILKEFVIAIRKGVRATDIIGRFGGDEFMIILPTGEKEKALKIAQSIARIVEGTAIRVNPQLTLSVTTSIGVATYPIDSGTAEDLFDKADQALYQVKRRGGNGAEMFG